MRGSAFTAPMPACAAVCAFGEVLSFAAAERPDPEEALAGLFARVHASLAPGGALLVDLAGPGREPAEAVVAGFRGPGWTVHVRRWEEDGVAHRVIRTERGDGRAEEAHHRLRLLDPARVRALLASAGFPDVDASRAYGDHALPEGVTAFCATRPG